MTTPAEDAALIQKAIQSLAAERQAEANRAAASAGLRATLNFQIATASPTDKPALVKQLMALNQSDYEYMVGFRSALHGQIIPATASDSMKTGFTDGTAALNAPTPTGVRGDGPKH